MMPRNSRVIVPRTAGRMDIAGKVLTLYVLVVTGRYAFAYYQDPAEGILQPEGITEESRHSEVNMEDADEDEDEKFEEEEEDDPETLKHLPTQCHVCRLLVREVESRLLKLGKVKKLRKHKSPMYDRKKEVILHAIQDLCQEMNKYRVRPRRPFRYKKGVQSAFRNIFDEATRNSKVQKWMWLTPESVIDDPTGEIGRLASQCHVMLVEQQFNLVEWFTTAQAQDLTSWLCLKRVLKRKNQDCLAIELPKKKKPPTINKDNLHSEL